MSTLGYAFVLGAFFTALLLGTAKAVGIAVFLSAVVAWVDVFLYRGGRR